MKGEIYNMKKFVIAIVIVLVLALGGCTFWLFSASNYSVDNAKRILNGNLSCLSGHTLGEPTCEHGSICSRCGAEFGEKGEHDWTEATCTERSKCRICGEETGELKAHDWVAATCELPEKCSACGESKGSALGHSKEIGKCSRCGRAMNEAVVTKITSHINKVAQYGTKAFNEMQKGGGHTGTLYECFLNYVSAQVYFNMSSSVYDDAIAACGSYAELRGLKSALQRSKNLLPTESVKESEKSLRAFLDQAKAYAESLDSVETELEKVVKDFK